MTDDRVAEAVDVDQPIPEDDAIAAAFPTRTGRHDLYAEAMRMVGAKHSKLALVELVNWLLAERDAALGEVAELRLLVTMLHLAWLGDGVDGGKALRETMGKVESTLARKLP